MMNVLDQTTATKMPFAPTHMAVTLVRAVKVNSCVLDSLAIVQSSYVDFPFLVKWCFKC